MPESNSQQPYRFELIFYHCELSYKDNAWKQFTTGMDNTESLELLWIIL